MLFSLLPRDGVPEPHEQLAEIYRRAGLELVEARPATVGEIAASGSTWAKKLHAGSARPVTRYVIARLST